MADNDYQSLILSNGKSLAISLYTEVQRRVSEVAVGQLKNLPLKSLAKRKAGGGHINKFSESPLKILRQTGASHIGGDIGVVSLKLREIVTSSLTSRCCQSVLLVGAEGAGKTSAVEYALKEFPLSEELLEGPVILWEDVAIHKDSVSCIRSLASKLQYLHEDKKTVLNEYENYYSDNESDYSDDYSMIGNALTLLPSVSKSDSSHLLQILKDLISRTSKSRTILIVLDNFDKLIIQGKGMGLYSLMDLMQYAPDTGLCLILTSTISDILQNRYFEKRIKSRFSMISLIVSPPSTLNHYLLPLLEDCLLIKGAEDDENCPDFLKDKKNQTKMKSLIEKYNATVRSQILNDKVNKSNWELEMLVSQDPRKIFYQSLQWVANFFGFYSSFPSATLCCAQLERRKAIIQDLSLTEHLVLCAMSRLHMQKKMPKTFRKVMVDIQVLSRKEVRENIHQAEVIFLKAYTRLLHFRLICRSMHSSVNPRVELRGIHMPIKFPLYHWYREKISIFGLPTALLNWVSQF